MSQKVGNKFHIMIVHHKIMSKISYRYYDDDNDGNFLSLVINQVVPIVAMTFIKKTE